MARRMVNWLAGWLSGAHAIQCRPSLMAAFSQVCPSVRPSVSSRRLAIIIEGAVATTAPPIDRQHARLSRPKWG